MSTYRSKFGTQRKMDNTPASPAYDIWAPANVETVYQCLRSLRAIEQQKNCQWCASLLAATPQSITSTFQICGWIKNLRHQNVALYPVFYSAAAWSGVVNFKLNSVGGTIYSLDVDFAGAGFKVYELKIDLSPVQYGTEIQIHSSTANLKLVHLGVYMDEGLPEEDIYPDQVLRPMSAIFSALRSKINAMALTESCVGGWCSPAAYTITANSKPATPQCRIYHGQQYADSKDLANYKQDYDFHGYVGTMPDLGDLGYEAALNQSSDSYSDIFRINNATLDAPLNGGSWATSAPRSIADLYLWRTNDSAKINLCCYGWWAKTLPCVGRPDVISDPGQFAAGEKILESSFVEIWQALHYNYLYGQAKPVFSWGPPGGAAVALTTSDAPLLYGAVPVASYQEPWGAEWTSGDVPFAFWWSALNGSSSARTIKVTYTWGADSHSDKWALAGSGSGQQYQEHKFSLAPPASPSPLIISMKIDTDTTITFSSGWGAISYPLDY